MFWLGDYWVDCEGVGFDFEKFINLCVILCEAKKHLDLIQ